MATFQQARVAFTAIRIIDGFDGAHNAPVKPIQAFKDNLAARFKALSLQRGLKDAVDAVNDRINEIQATFADRMTMLDDGKSRFVDAKAMAEYEKAVNAELNKDVPDLDVERLAIKMSMIGPSVQHIPADLLMDLGPFLDFDTTDPPELKRK